MNKAVLILDMPSSCKECPCWYICCYTPKCIILNKSLETNEIYEKKPDWCPLKPMPEKKPHTQSFLEDFIITGYNACIEELLKGERTE